MATVLFDARSLATMDGSSTTSWILVVDDGVGSTEIDGDLLHEKIEQAHCYQIWG